jgi:hypothetical protein
MTDSLVKRVLAILNYLQPKVVDFWTNVPSCVGMRVRKTGARTVCMGLSIGSRRTYGQTWMDSVLSVALVPVVATSVRTSVFMAPIPIPHRRGALVVSLV